MMPIKQNFLRLFGIILFNILGSFLGIIILASASRNMNLAEFGLLGVFTSLLYVPGLIANVVQINGMEVTPAAIKSSKSFKLCE